jgi:FlaA1/EpsC-like NDP-sugar epimerase
MNLRKAPRTLVLTAGYAVLVNAAAGLALALRYDGAPPAEALDVWRRVAPAWTALSLLGFLWAGLYHGLWRYAGTATLFQLARGVTLSAIAWWALTRLGPAGARFPGGLALSVLAWEFLLLGSVRLAWRLWRDRTLGGSGARLARTLLIGADHAAVGLVQEMRRKRAGEEAHEPIGFVDPDPRLTGHLVEGLRVFGTVADLPRVLAEQRPEVAVVANPELPGRVVRDAAAACEAAGVRLRTVPAPAELPPGARVTLSRVRDVRLEDLLGREPAPGPDEDVGEFLRGRRVLVTGAGGSIGAELARQALRFAPAELVLVDHAENGLYFVQRELEGPGVPVRARVAELRDATGLDALFARHRPEVVLHAAAHKHVPLLEDAPREAVLNNVTGTRLLLEAADRHGVAHFVLVSTDKAVHPSSVMGATKRVCERMVQAASRRGRGRYCAVRFGNVLGSEGSVVPLFQRQIARGGPVTVTHPEATRYFMTVSEAVRLVLQAAAMGRGGEVFLLDMGEPVRVADLARQLIRLAGLHEGEDIEVTFTGLRPGEKLHEELHSRSEQARVTRRERILAWDLPAEDEAALAADVLELERAAGSGDADAIRAALRRAAPGYAPAGSDDAGRGDGERPGGRDSGEGRS